MPTEKKATKNRKLNHVVKENMHNKDNPMKKINKSDVYLPAYPSELKRLAAFTQEQNQNKYHEKFILLSHPLLDKNLIVAPVNYLDDQQLGLFAGKRYEIGERVALVEGVHLTKEQKASEVKDICDKQEFGDYIWQVPCDELNSIAIDSRVKGTIARYANHSENDSNVEIRYIDGQLYYVAIRVINPFEEITASYGEDYFKGKNFVNPDTKPTLAEMLIAGSTNNALQTANEGKTANEGDRESSNTITQKELNSLVQDGAIDMTQLATLLETGITPAAKIASNLDGKEEIETDGLVEEIEANQPSSGGLFFNEHDDVLLFKDLKPEESNTVLNVAVGRKITFTTKQNLVIAPLSMGIGTEAVREFGLYAAESIKAGTEICKIKGKEFSKKDKPVDKHLLKIDDCFISCDSECIFVQAVSSEREANAKIDKKTKTIKAKRAIKPREQIRVFYGPDCPPLPSYTLISTIKEINASQNYPSIRFIGDPQEEYGDFSIKILNHKKANKDETLSPNSQEEIKEKSSEYNDVRVEENTSQMEYEEKEDSNAKKTQESRKAPSKDQPQERKRKKNAEKKNAEMISSEKEGSDAEISPPVKRRKKSTKKKKEEPNKWVFKQNRQLQKAYEEVPKEYVRQQREDGSWFVEVNGEKKSIEEKTVGAFRNNLYRTKKQGGERTSENNTFREDIVKDTDPVVKPDADKMFIIIQPHGTVSAYESTGLREVRKADGDNNYYIWNADKSAIQRVKQITIAAFARKQRFSSLVWVYEKPNDDGKLEKIPNNGEENEEFVITNKTNAPYNDHKGDPINSEGYLNGMKVIQMAKSVFKAKNQRVEKEAAKPNEELSGVPHVKKDTSVKKASGKKISGKKSTVSQLGIFGATNKLPVAGTPSESHKENEPYQKRNSPNE